MAVTKLETWTFVTSSFCVVDSTRAMRFFQDVWSNPTSLGYMGVSKNRGGPPNWMVYFMENPIKMDDLEGFPPIFGSTPT